MHIQHFIVKHWVTKNIVSLLEKSPKPYGNNLTLTLPWCTIVSIFKY